MLQLLGQNHTKEAEIQNDVPYIIHLSLLDNCWHSPSLLEENKPHYQHLGRLPKTGSSNIISMRSNPIILSYFLLLLTPFHYKSAYKEGMPVSGFEATWAAIFVFHWNATI